MSELVKNFKEWVEAEKVTAYEQRQDHSAFSPDYEYWTGVIDHLDLAKRTLVRMERDLDQTTPIRNATINLWRSTSDFFMRFLNRYPPIMDQLRVLHEEELEVTQAALTQPENLPAEVADLIVTAMGLMMSLGFTIDDLNDAMLKVAAKNDSKTHETHEINSAGKIARIVKAE